jgi:hypothetical protein
MIVQKKRVPDSPAGSQNAGNHQGKRFVEKIGKDCTKDTERKCLSVMSQVPESNADKGTTKDVGEDKHDNFGGDFRI